jgi:hypothetical protein
MPSLYALHDKDAYPHVPSGGWCIESIALSENPQPQNWSAIRGDIQWILRLNCAHNGKDGTIPLPGQYDEFAKQCADYVARATGADWFVIANEPNHAQERPQGQLITPENYALCFNRCYQAIKQSLPHVNVLVAAVAPWDNSSDIDFLAYYQRMLSAIQTCDGFALHTYTHGANPELIFNQEMQHGWYWHFPILYQQMGAIPARFYHLPVHVTETDQGDNAWVDTNSGWVQNAYDSIDEHNRVGGEQPILSLALYRWRGDKYELYNKPQVLADFQVAVVKGYQSPAVPPPPNLQPRPPLPRGRSIDPALIARGVTFTFAEVPADTWYWRLVKAEWLDEEEADAVGPDHHILGTIKKDGQEVADVKLSVAWPSGQTTVTSKLDQPYTSYNYDYPMSASLNEYSIWVQGAPSDRVNGIGMGMNGNTGIHTSTWLDFVWTQGGEALKPPRPTPSHTEYVLPLAGANLRTHPGGQVLVAVPYEHAVEVDGTQQGNDGYEWKHSTYHQYVGWIRGDLLSETSPIPPKPLPPVDGDIVHPLPGAVITQHWGQAAPEYAPGMWGHSGTDLAGLPRGTPVRAMTSGTVIVAASDHNGLGHYLRIAHREKDAFSVYGHCDTLLAAVGKVVVAGETIARIGSTGNSTGPHLHFEIRLMDEVGNYLAGTPQPSGRVDPETWMVMHGVKL